MGFNIVRAEVNIFLVALLHHKKNKSDKERGEMTSILFCHFHKFAKPAVKPTLLILNNCRCEGVWGHGSSSLDQYCCH